MSVCFFSCKHTALPGKMFYFMKIVIYYVSNCTIIGMPIYNTDRNIMQSTQRFYRYVNNATLCIGFIDFKNAVNSIHHSILWKILRHHGLPQKIVDLTSILYQKFECSILMEINQTNRFSVRSGVRQGGILSPILIRLALDYIMRQAPHNAHHGMQWTIFSQLEDLDYADYIALLYNSTSSAEGGTASHIKC